jgi:predicted metal-dependent phosphoesterase TrpH
MGKADLHIHTDEGDGLDSALTLFEQIEAKGELDVVAITEHDDLAVALRARELWLRRGYRFDFVPGVEVTTLDGHLLALYVNEPVASLRRVEETVEAVRRQGGLCVVPHPMSWLTRSLGARSIDRVVASGLHFDGIELANASPIVRPFLAKARRLNSERFGITPVGASDAHFAAAAGSAYTEFIGTTAVELRAAIESGAVAARQARFPSLREAGLLRTLALPVTGLRATPRKLGWRRTTWSFVSRYLP